MVPEVNLMGILHTKGSMVRAMCGVQLKDSKRSTDLMFMLGYEGIYGSVGYGKQCFHFKHVPISREMVRFL